MDTVIVFIIYFFRRRTMRRCALRVSNDRGFREWLML